MPSAPEGTFVGRSALVFWNLAAHRAERVAESIREELDELISYEMSDPRVGSVSVTEVHCSPDFRHAHIRLGLNGTTEEQTATIEALNGAKHFLRHQLAERLQLYRTPELYFEADLSPELGPKVAQLLKRVRRGRPRD